MAKLRFRIAWIVRDGFELDQALDYLREALELHFEDVDLTDLPVTVKLPQLWAHARQFCRDSKSPPLLDVRGSWR